MILSLYPKGGKKNPRMKLLKCWFFALNKGQKQCESSTPGIPLYLNSINFKNSILPQSSGYC